MPDSFLPSSGGPGSFDERDLDAVLSGESADIPLALGLVADTLAALRGAPASAELAGEAAALAEFRASVGGSAGPAQTLVLPARPEGRSPRRAARHRASRRPVPSVSRRAGVLMGVAAAVLIGVVVVSGNLPGPIERITHLGRTSSASPSATPSSGGNLTGAGATPTRLATTPATRPEQTPTPSQAGPSPSPSLSPATDRLCQEVYGYHTHESRASWTSFYEQLVKLADSSNPVWVFRYCSPYLGDMFHFESPRAGTRTQNQGPQNQDQGKPSANAAKAKPSPGASSAPTPQGAAGSGNGNGSSGPGQASQDGGSGSNP